MSIVEKYKITRERTIEICQHLSPEDQVVQSVYYASPAKWHLAHTTWFFEEMILKKTDQYEEYNAEFGFLFNSYYNTIGERTLRAERGNITRPILEEVLRYRSYVDEKMLSSLNSNLFNEDSLNLIELGLNHEQQHQELLITDLKFTLGHNPLFPVYHKNVNLLKDYNEETGFANISEGIYEIGYQGDKFCFDNELRCHKVYINSFEISKSLVTNKDYMEFMSSGAYTDFRYWLDEGWTWVQENNIDSPLYWHKINGDWHYYTLAGLQKIDENAILSHVSFYEAQAFAAWKGFRLPTEFEWEVACKHFKWGKRWEWTNSAYLPYPGFKISEGAVGEYNGKFMVNQMVLRGASVATAKGHSRSSYRNFFHPHFQWQFSGIRLVK